MPRAFSSGSRSVSMPVSARTSAVLPWSMWPAVPSVSARAAVTQARDGRVRVAERAAVEQERPSPRARDGGIALAQGAAAVGAPSSRTPRGSSASGSAPPPTRASRLDDLAAERGRERLGAGAHVVERLERHAQHGQPARASAGSRCRRSVASSAASERRSRRSARASGWRRQARPRRRADDDPGLRAAEQLVAAEADEVAPRDRPAGVGLAGQHGGREQPPEPRSSTTGAGVAPIRGELAHLDVVGEADDAVVGRVHAQDRAVSGPIACS